MIRVDASDCIEGGKQAVAPLVLDCKDGEVQHGPLMQLRAEWPVLHPQSGHLKWAGGPGPLPSCSLLASFLG